MKVKVFYFVLLFSFWTNLPAQYSYRILKYYDGFTQKSLDQLGIAGPFSSQPSCRATVTKKRPDGGYYMMAFATDRNFHRIVYADVGKGLSSWSKVYGKYGSNDGQFSRPRGAAADQFGNVYVADSGNNRIVKLYCDFETGNMNFVKNITVDFNQPYDVAISTNGTPDDPSDDRIWVADYGNNRIVELSKDGDFLRSIGNAGSGVMEFKNPTSIKVYGYNVNNIVYLVVGDDGNDRVVNMGTDGTWYEIPLSPNDKIVSVDLYDDEIYVLEKFSGLVHKIRWPDIYLANFNGVSPTSPEKLNFPNSVSVPFPEMMPYVCVFEQWGQTTGCKLFVQGVDVLGIESGSNVNGTAVQVNYRLPTNSVITERIVDESGNVVKTLTDGIVADSSPLVSSTWYGDDDSGNQVPGGTYYYKCTAKTKWEYDNSSAPLAKRVLNKIVGVSSSEEPGDSLIKTVRINIPLTLAVSPGPEEGIDNTLYWKSNWAGSADAVVYNNNQLSIGTEAGNGFYGIKRAIMKFDLRNTRLTPRDKVTDASLMLRFSACNNSENQTINVHRVLVPWDEMSSCWNRPDEGTEFWNGCDPNGGFASREPVASVIKSTQTGWYEWYGENMTNLVQDWITNPATNYGVLIKIADDNRNEDHQFHFWSSDVSDSTLRPRLEIVYEKDVLYPVFKAEIVAYPVSGEAPLTVKFDASNSYSPSGIETYSWDFDASDNIEEDTVGVIVSHIFDSPGDYLVTLTTIDSANIRGYDTLAIHIYPEGSFTDDFEDGDSKGWTPLNPVRWTVGQDNGSYAYYINTSDYEALPGWRLGEYSLINGSNYGDFTFTCKARTRENLGSNGWADYAIVFGYQDGNNYYYMMFNAANTETRLFKVVEGQRYTVETAVGSWITDNNFHDIEITRVGSDITVKYNLLTVLTASDTTFGAGQIGVGSLNDAASFDDVVIHLNGIEKRSQQKMLAEIPKTFGLKQNYPNPFNPSTIIQYQLPHAVHVTLKIYDMLGRQITTLVDEQKEAGCHQIAWDGKDNNGIPCASGIYIVRIIAGKFITTRKMLLIK